MKAVLWIIVALLILAGVYYWYTHKAVAPATTTSAAAVTAAPASSAQRASSLPSGSDTSDAALAQDASSINAQMQSFNSDNAAIDSGMNDKPVSQ